MLILRQEQRVAIALATQLARSTEWLAYLRDRHAEKAAVMGDASLDGFVKMHLSRAAEYGLSEPKDIRRLLDMTLVLGPKLSPEDEAWISGVLRDDQISDPQRRMDKLYRRFLYRLEGMQT